MSSEAPGKAELGFELLFAALDQGSKVGGGGGVWEGAAPGRQKGGGVGRGLLSLQGGALTGTGPSPLGLLFVFPSAPLSARLVIPRHSVGSWLSRLPCRHSPWVPATVPGPGSGASETGERGTEMETEERA